MKKMSKTKPAARDGLRSEYRFDYSNSTPNRFVKEAQGSRRTIELDPDVAAAFPDAKEANEALRAIAEILRKRQSSL